MPSSPRQRPERKRPLRAGVHAHAHVVVRVRLERHRRRRARPARSSSSTARTSRLLPASARTRRPGRRELRDLVDARQVSNFTDDADGDGASGCGRTRRPTAAAARPCNVNVRSRPLLHDLARVGRRSSPAPRTRRARGRRRRPA